MEFRQLQTFIQAAQLQSFSRAAVQLGYSQSAVTVQIRILEKELGTRLFDRMGKQVVLTPQGQKFLMHANTILYEVNRTRLSMHEDEELKNPLHIGTIESLCAAKLPAIVSRFREHHPQVKLQITVGTPEELIRMMEHDQLDIIYILDAPRWNESWVKAMEVAEPVVFVASPAFWAQKYAECENIGSVKWRTKTVGQEEISVRWITLDQILQEPFFLTEKNANYRQALDQHLASCRCCCCLSPVLFFRCLRCRSRSGREHLLLWRWMTWKYPCTVRSFTTKISSERGKWSSSSPLRPRKKTIDEKLIP